MLKRLLAVLLLVSIVAFGVAAPATAQEESAPGVWDDEQMVRAKVLKVEDMEDSEESAGIPGREKEQLVTVSIMSGVHRGETVYVNHVILDHPGYNINVGPGDEVILYLETEGADITTAYITEIARDKKLFYFALSFGLLLVLIGGMKGLKSVICLALTGVAIIYVLLPMMLKGYNPIVITVLISAAVTAVTLTMIGGLSAKTVSAVIGTTGGVLVAGVLAWLVGTAVHLSGFSSEEVHMLMYVPQTSFDYRGILFSGMIIGALGAVMDVGISIASAVEEIKKANPKLGAGALIRAGMNVGRDFMGTMSNTLILAYTGGSIPLLLLFMGYDTPLLKIVNLDMIATEVVRSLAGSIGLVLAVPITSFVAGILMGQRESR